MMTISLDTNVSAIFDDARQVNRVVQAIALDRDLDYVQALEAFHEAAGNARDEGRGSLRSVLEWTHSDPAYVVRAIGSLEQRDAAVAAVYDTAAKPLTLERADRGGKVFLDQGAVGGQSPEGTDADIGLILGDAPTFERRLARIRRAEPGRWVDDEGRDRFRLEDKLFAEQGYDRVRTAERPLDLVAAQADAQRVAARLDAAVAIESEKHAKLIALDMAVVQAQENHLRMLDQGAERRDVDPVQERVRQMEAFDERIQGHMKRFGLPDSDYPEVLAQMLREVGQTGTVSPPWAPAPDVPGGD